jgi:hypothetical protein
MDMNDEETMLDGRDLYLLGVRAEGAHEHAIGMGQFPRGCNEAQAEALLRAGYLVSISYGFADGTAGVRYEITPQGQDAWTACRFT